MSLATELTVPPEIEYPDCDGQPMADNTLQFEHIVTIKGNLDVIFRDDPNVFVAGDLLWYPVEGAPTIRRAPDVMAAFGRPKGYRGSFKQWVEDNIAPQVTIEVLSPGNRFGELLRKFQFYERYGVEEYYVYDPDNEVLSGWLRDGHQLREIPNMDGWVSPRLGICFRFEEGRWQFYRPDGSRFLTFVEIEGLREAAQAQAEAERRQREAAQAQAEAAQAQAEAERRQREAAQAQAEAERLKREAVQAQFERMAARLRALGEDPEA